VLARLSIEPACPFPAWHRLASLQAPPESATCSRICSRTAHNYLDGAGQNSTI